MSDGAHFNRKPIRDAEIVKPPNIIKAKVGGGGISDEVLDRTQKLLESYATDFEPLAMMYLDQMHAGIDNAKSNHTSDKHLNEEYIALILYPCVQLKANGGMFQYPIITRIADIFIHFMEVVERLDKEVLEIAIAFHTTMKVVIASKIQTDGGEQAEALISELNNACHRYFDKHKKDLNL